MNTLEWGSVIVGLINLTGLLYFGKKYKDYIGRFRFLIDEQKRLNEMYEDECRKTAEAYKIYVKEAEAYRILTEKSKIDKVI
jgi:hypothetical protein